MEWRDSVWWLEETNVKCNVIVNEKVFEKLNVYDN
jgi:hypothetical protein